MTITQSADNLVGSNYIRKRHRIDFIDEKLIVLPLPSFLSIPVSFPSNWNSITFTSNIDYANQHPMNTASFILTIPNISSYKLTTFYLDTGIPTYNIGRAFCSRGTSLSDAIHLREQQILYPRIVLFNNEFFTLNPEAYVYYVQLFILSFVSPMTGFLILQQQIPKIF